MSEKNTVEISGASDDLIEIDGAIREEFSASKEVNYLAFSDGTLLSIQYGVGGAFWRINQLAVGSAKYEKREATDEREDYSDRVTLTGDIKWVVYGTERAKR